MPGESPAPGHTAGVRWPRSPGQPRPQAGARRPCRGSWQPPELAWPIPSCPPASRVAEPPALSLVPGCTASSCWAQGWGCCPHLGAALTLALPSVGAPQAREGLPRRGEPGTGWPSSGYALPWLRPSRPRGPPHPGDLPLPTSSSPGLLGSSPSWLAPLLAPSREGRVLSGLPSRLASHTGLGGCLSLSTQDPHGPLLPPL